MTGVAQLPPPYGLDDTQFEKLKDKYHIDSNDATDNIISIYTKNITDKIPEVVNDIATKINDYMIAAPAPVTGNAERYKQGNNAFNIPNITEDLTAKIKHNEFNNDEVNNVNTFIEKKNELNDIFKLLTNQTVIKDASDIIFYNLSSLELIRMFLVDAFVINRDANTDATFFDDRTVVEIQKLYSNVCTLYDEAFANWNKLLDSIRQILVIMEKLIMHKKEVDYDENLYHINNTKLRDILKQVINKSVPGGGVVAEPFPSYNVFRLLQDTIGQNILFEPAVEGGAGAIQFQVNNVDVTTSIPTPADGGEMTYNNIRAITFYAEQLPARGASQKYTVFLKYDGYTALLEEKNTTLPAQRYRGGKPFHNKTHANSKPLPFSKKKSVKKHHKHL